MSSQSAPTGKSSTPSTCPECGGHLDRVGGETHCSDCGLVVEEQQIDHGPEWRSFDEDECRRTGAPRTVTRHDKGLSTEIGRAHSDANGTVLTARKKRRLSRQRTLHRRSRFESKRQRNLSHGLGEIRRVTSALELSDTIRTQACSLFKTAQDADLLIGRSIEGGAAAAVYIACRCNNAIEMHRLAEVARCSESHIWTVYKVFQRDLELPIPIERPSERVPRVLEAMPVPATDATGRRARELAQLVDDEQGFTGSRRAIAAGCVYLASEETGQEWTQTTVAEAAGVVPQTLRTWYRQLQDHVNE
ncbi:transcription initiation factor IIB family protein [Halomicroarcula sp. F28]|uniref:transcription initiation factor IIB n=1 Tax=Haloarcula salinisoli TaxID=2487746 RepID=UPI001C735107|nr:transcription initiation factor IIB family protein [Halomicroarcula salinisoli]MBX0288438.1 transcription initiation factor IIB family protein [Halomicroarcula salinisoli]